MIRLSIIIPVYNVEEYVGQCLRSVFDGGSDESLYEVIVVNDGTPDNSMRVVRQLCAGHANVKIVEQDNQGLSAARTTGLNQSEGDYVWFVDSDDWLKEGAVDSIMGVLSRHPGYSVYAMPLTWVSGKKNHADYTITEDQPYIGKELLRTPYPLWAIPRYVIKRDLLDNKSIFFPKGLLHEDEYYYRALIYNAPKVLLMKDSLYYYRQRDDSIMGARSIRSFYDKISIYKALESFLLNSAEECDKWWLQRDIVSFLLKNYKESFDVTGREVKEFRNRYRRLILKKGMCCRDFSFKEKMWILNLLIR